MKQYLIRSVKYLIWLTLLFIVVFLLMILTGGSQVGPAESLELLFGSSRGTIMICAIVFLALLYPALRVCDPRDSGRSAHQSRGDLGSLLPKRVSPDGRECEWDGLSGQYRMGNGCCCSGEDTLRVVPTPAGFTIGGLRREAVKVEFRLKPMLAIGQRVGQTS